jgi:hypothetical protein
MEIMVGRWAGPHTGPADRKTPLRVGTPQQDADAASCCSATSSEVRSLVSIDLLGRTGLARLHLRVRFGVADENANVKCRPDRASQDLWTGGNA